MATGATLLLCLASILPQAEDFIVHNDVETVRDAVDFLRAERLVDAPQLVCGCVTSGSPLSVTLDYRSGNRTAHRIIGLFRPWRTFGWRTADVDVPRCRPGWCVVQANLTQPTSGGD